ncbi:unnamed protein product [Merluccius merluccius]
MALIKILLPSHLLALSPFPSPHPQQAQPLPQFQDCFHHGPLDILGGLFRASQYWRQNSRKVFAMTEEALEEFQSGRRAKNSRRAEDSASAVLVDKVDDLKAAAEGLQTVAEAIRHLTNLARPALQPAKEAMKCLVCKGINYLGPVVRHLLRVYGWLQDLRGEVVFEL